MTLLPPNEVQRVLRLISQAFMSSLSFIPVSMFEQLPNLVPENLAITCMVWNVQGAGNRNLVSALKEIVRQHRPTVIALVETHMGGGQSLNIASSLGYTGHTRVDAMVFSGGIWVYWKTELVMVDPIIKHEQHITMEIKRVCAIPWYFSAVYASPDPTKRQDLWKELENFAKNHNLPWLIAGDFNDTRYPSERNSACIETQRRSHKFNEWIHDMDLIEVEFLGANHTWARGLTPETRKSARLDRALCNGDWGCRFTNAKVKHLPAIQSDHCPIFISPNGFAPLHNINKPFKFQAAWLKHESFKEFVESKWDTSRPLLSALSKLDEELQTWNKETFGNIFHQKKTLLARIARIQKNLSTRVDRGLMKLEARLRRELDDVLEREEIFWYQKSRIDWLKNGDRNTSFFHMSTIIRRWRNKIDSLTNDEGIWLQNSDEIRDHIVSYFKILFTADNEPEAFNVPSDIFPELSSRDWEALSKPFGKLEIDEVVNNMGSLKAPGPDGFQALFFQKH